MKYNIGDLIHYAKGITKGSYNAEDIGYIYKIDDDGIHIKWFKTFDVTCETKNSIKDMPETYIYPVKK